MARKKRFGKRLASRFRSFKKRSRHGGSSENLMVTMLAAGAYGASRPMIENWIQPVTSKIPVVGNYADEVALGTVGYLLAKGKMPFLKGKAARSVGKAVVIIEAARIGSGLMQGISPVSNETQTSGSNFTDTWGSY
jgi:hypothetical protein